MGGLFGFYFVVSVRFDMPQSGPQGPYRPTADAKKHPALVAAIIGSHTPSMRTTILIFWMQVLHTELRFCAKSRQHFLFRYSDIEN